MICLPGWVDRYVPSPDQSLRELFCPGIGLDLMSTNHWQSLFRAWSGLSTPVHVLPDVIASIKAEVAGVTGPILVLGLTSGLLDAGPI